MVRDGLGMEGVVRVRVGLGTGLNPDLISCPKKWQLKKIGLKKLEKSIFLKPPTPSSSEKMTTKKKRKQKKTEAKKNETWKKLKLKKKLKAKNLLFIYIQLLFLNFVLKLCCQTVLSNCLCAV